MYVIPWTDSYLSVDSLIESNAPGEVYDWSADTTYYQGNLVRGADGNVYECSVGPAKFSAGQYCSQPHGEGLDNKGNNPVEYPTVPAMDRTAYPDYVDIADCFVESGKLWWIKRGDEKTWLNKYRLFSQNLDMATTGPLGGGGISTLRMTLRANNAFSTLAFLRTYATKIRFIGPVLAFGAPLASEGGEIPDSSELLSSSSSGGGIDEDIRTIELDLEVQGVRHIPGGNFYRNSILQLNGNCPTGAEFVIEIELDMTRLGTTNRATCGWMAAGYTINIGTLLYNSTVGIQDFSRKERDAFGNLEIIARDYTNRFVYKIALDTKEIYGVKEFLAINRAKPCVYIGDLDMFGTIAAGYYKDFSIPYESYTQSIFNLEVEGL